MAVKICFYSLDGHSERVAQKLGKSIEGASIVQILPQKEIPKKGFLKYFIGGMQSTLRMKPKLISEVPHIEDNDKVVLITPVWAGKIAAPMRSFLSKADFNGASVITISMCGGSKGNSFEELQDLIIDGTIKEQFVITQKESINDVIEVILSSINQ